MRILLTIALLLTISLFITTQAQEPNWSVNNPESFEYSMNMTAALFIDGAISKDPNDRIAFFYGDVCRGQAQLTDIGEGQLLAFITIYSNQPDDEPLTITVFDHSSSSIIDMDLSINFQADSVLGTIENPFNIGSIPLLTTETRSSVSIYPNPTTHYLYLDGSGLSGWQIIDLHGKLLMNGSGHRINVQALQAGFYFLKHGNKTSRFIKN